MISYEDFSKLDIRIGTIISAEKVPEADKLLKLIVDIGDEKRQLMAGIAEFVEDIDSLAGKQIPVLVNLQYRKMRGYESQGMMLAADDGEPVLLHPEKKVINGSKVM